ncbi:CST complex subunit TEN1-like [Prunus avium]|uniref:CST complex subunit TEN1-like n=1 Tax=Prunus avium TaxID=42229 RepID=A0A6P5SZL7_PRUAV|nr:CST complex subunit TEN1-like [Prunus avium]XP_021819129.1 CST complex subunit TEN1-like [Prunus avium]
MTSSEIKSGALVSLQDLHPSSSYFKQGASLRVTGKLQEYSVEIAIATIVDGSDSLKINTQYLRELSFRVGSIYQFIGELLIQPDNGAVLQARVGRNVDGIDLNLYYQSLQLLRQFQAHHLKNPAT